MEVCVPRFIDRAAFARRGGGGRRGEAGRGRCAFFSYFIPSRSYFNPFILLFTSRVIFMVRYLFQAFVLWCSIGQLLQVSLVFCCWMHHVRLSSLAAFPPRRRPPCSVPLAKSALLMKQGVENLYRLHSPPPPTPSLVMLRVYVDGFLLDQIESPARSLGAPALPNEPASYGA